ncbi:CARDB domain-containing protein [uncultured Microbacterium sp.]|uniref:CARDB domain-containing protein n=1 Tax=uncultured Microbacterium sp. TaxID=191216 RepID=A0A1Y5PBR2_9MICO|nr:CARDB domain-containing protein [uncultured Microbacterium sp.]SBS74910.1 conserved hypothetical protein [uncultured Microbacterium sp.]
MALIDGITSGLSLALLGDGSIIQLERPKARAWMLVHSAADGARLNSTAHRRAIADVAAHPTDATSAVAAIPTRGVATVAPTVAAVSLSALADAGGAVALTATGATITVVTRGRAARHLEVDPATGTVTDIGKAPSGVVDIVAHPSESAVLALAGWAPRRRLYVLRAGSAPQPIAKTPGATRIATFAPGDQRLVIGYADGRTALIDLTTPTTAPEPLDAGAGAVWGLATRGDEVLVGTGAEVRVVPLVEAPGVEITIDAVHYLASWTRARVACRGGVSFDSLLFAVDPPEGGLVSASRDASFDPAHPDVVVAIGGIVGDYKLVAMDAATGAVHTAAAFSITDTWSGVDGPPTALIGPAENAAPDASWGGGDPYVPQNLDVRPRRGDYRVAVLLVETDDQATLTAAEVTALTQTLRQEIFTGVMRGGVLESTRLYYDAVSDGQLNLVEAGIIVPVHLPNDWDDYVDPEATGRTQGDGLSNFTTAAVAEIVRQNRDRTAAGQPLVLDLDAVDSIIAVMRSIPAGAPAGFPGRHQWPYGTRPGGYQMSFIVGEDRLSLPFGFEISIPRIRNIQALTMPTTWTAISNGRTLAETVGHELGHNFGLHDSYWVSTKHLAEYQSRAPGTWDLMGNEEGAPEPAVVERMHLGWVPGGQVRTISVGVAGFVDEEVTLHASGRGVPVPAGRRQAVELRIANGRNYYFEYRRRNAAALSDQAIPEDFVVLGTDYISGDTPPTDRRPLLMLRNDSDNDDATFSLNDDYREQDTTDPSYPNDFAMTVLETAGDFARVRLRYADAKPDPSILPWGQSTNWKSPDLRVENHRNRLNPALRDVPWEGHDNWIVATIRNTGRDVANDIEVRFAVKDFTLGGGAETGLGTITIPTLAAGATTEVTSPDVWRPPALSGIPFLDIRPHYCVIARITAQPGEITRDNNEAQSNHTRMISASGSPSTRETGVVRVTNPHAVPARCRVVVRQTDRLSRTYLERAWVQLDPGEERDVRFWTESMIGDPALGRFWEERKSQSWELPNSLRLTGVADTGEGCHGDVTGGAHVEVWFGRRTRFVDLYVGRGYARGRVEVEEDGDGVWGTVVVSLREDKEGKDLGVYEGRVENGNFAFEFRAEQGEVEGARVAQAEFSGGYSAAAAISEWVEVQQ